MRFSVALVLLCCPLCPTRPCQADVFAQPLGSVQLFDPRMYRVGSDTLVIRATIKGPDTLFFLVTDHGSNWKMVRTTAPPELPTGDGFACLALAEHNIFLGGRQELTNKPDPSEMPVWFSRAGAWSTGNLNGGVLRGTTTRHIRSLAPGNTIGQIIHAAGWEHVQGSGQCARVWRSSDGGAHWDIVQMAGLGNPQDAVLLDTTPGYTAWGFTGAGFFRLGPGNAAALVPWPQGLVSLDSLSAPTDDELFILWQVSEGENALHALSYSSDRGATWQNLALFNYGHHKHWVEIIRSPHKLMDFADSNFGIIALRIPTTAGTGWNLLVTGDRGKTYTQESLGSYHVIDVDTVSPTEAYILATDHQTSRLYCLRWKPPAEPKPDLSGLPTIVDTSPTRLTETFADLPELAVEPGTLVIDPSTIGVPPDTPVLLWLGQGAYTRGGVDPTAGSAATAFEFQVVYRHPQDKPPKHVKLKLSGISQRWALQEDRKLGNGYKDGVVYNVTVPPNTLKAGTTYHYRFSATDGTRQAVGAPTQSDQDRTLTVAP